MTPAPDPPAASFLQPPPAGWARGIAHRYTEHWARHYTQCKLALDPVYPATAAALDGASAMPLLDIGCGMGLLAAYLGTCGWKAPIYGLDYDGRKIATAQRTWAHEPAWCFQQADVRAGLPGHSGHVAILDVLQFFTPSGQQALAAAAAARVAPGGLLIIRSTLSDASWQFRLTQAGDWLAKATFWMKAAPTAYPPRESLVRWLEEAGLTGSIRRLTGAIPFNNFFLAFRRPA